MTVRSRSGEFCTDCLKNGKRYDVGLKKYE